MQVAQGGTPDHADRENDTEIQKREKQYADAVVGIMSKMLDSLSQDGMAGFTKSDFYRHMES